MAELNLLKINLMEMKTRSSILQLFAYNKALYIFRLPRMSIYDEAIKFASGFVNKKKKVCRIRQIRKKPQISKVIYLTHWWV